MSKPRGKQNRCRVMHSRIFQTFDKITMQALSCAHNRSHDWEREEARCAIRRFARYARIAGSCKAVRVTFNERKTLLHLLFFSLTLSPSFFLFFRDGLSLVWLVPFAFFSRSSRKQIAAVSFSHLAASIPYFVFFAPVDRLTICIMLEVTSRFENFLHGNAHSPLVLPIEFSSLVDNRVYANPDTLPLFFTSRSCRPFYSPPPPHHVNYNEEGIWDNSSDPHT